MALRCPVPLLVALQSSLSRTYATHFRKSRRHHLNNHNETGYSHHTTIKVLLPTSRSRQPCSSSKQPHQDCLKSEWNHSICSRSNCSHVITSPQLLSEWGQRGWQNDHVAQLHCCKAKWLIQCNTMRFAWRRDSESAVFPIWICHTNTGYDFFPLLQMSNEHTIRCKKMGQFYYPQFVIHQAVYLFIPHLSPAKWDSRWPTHINTIS